MWKREARQARAVLDERYARTGGAQDLAPPAGGWVKSIRQALGMSPRQFAGRMGLTRQRIEVLEKAELHGGVTLKSLRRAAEALDSVLVYAIIPKVPLEDMVADKARDIARRELAFVDQTMALEDQALSAAQYEDQIADYIETHLSEKDLWGEL